MKHKRMPGLALPGQTERARDPAGDPVAPDEAGRSPAGQPGAVPRRVYLSYADADIGHAKALQQHLAVLRSRGHIEIWHRGLLQPGFVVADEVEYQLRNAELLIILLSADYIGGEGEHRREYQWLIAQDLQNQKSIIAVNLRPVSLADCPLSQLPQLPSSGQPVVDAGNPDQAWREVAESVRQHLGLPKAKPRLLLRERAVSGAQPIHRTTPWPTIRRACLAAAIGGALWLKFIPQTTDVKWIYVSVFAILLILYELFYSFIVRLISHYRERSAYLHHVCELHQSVELRGLRAMSIPLRLDQVYVDLAIAHSPDPERPNENLLSAKQLEGNHPIWAYLRHLQRRDPQGQPNTAVVITGPPGSGKTTLLQHVAVALAKRRHRKLGIAWRLPILLFVRELPSWLDQTDPPDLADLLHRGKSPELPGMATWLATELSAGRCLILLDGLDEVGDLSARQAVVRWIDAQRLRYDRCQFVLTSRPQGYHQARLARGCLLLEMQPLSGAQVRQFLEAWAFAHEVHLAEVEQGPLGPLATLQVRRQARQQTRELLARLSVRPALADFTHNPLLLTMIAIVHRYGGALPEQRVALYHEICDALLGRWRGARGVQDGLPLESKRQVLEALASHMMAQRKREVSRTELNSLLSQWAAELGHPSAQASRWLEVLRIECGLLLEVEADHFGFPHLTIQEYLAASHWARTGSFPLPLRHLVSESWWYEAVRLYSAQSDASSIVEECLRLQGAGGLALALDCMEEAKQLAPALRERVNEAWQVALDSGDAGQRQAAAEALLRRRLKQLKPLADDLLIDTSFISHAEYQLFLDERRQGGQAMPPDHWPGDSYPRGQATEPVLGMRGADAQAFCAWLTDKMGRGLYAYRLPTPEELEASRDYRVIGKERTPWTRDAGGTFGPAQAPLARAAIVFSFSGALTLDPHGPLAKSDWAPLLTLALERDPSRPGYELALPALVQSLADWVQADYGRVFPQADYLARFLPQKVQPVLHIASRTVWTTFTPEGLRGQVQSAEALVPTQHSTAARAQLYERIEQEFLAPLDELRGSPDLPEQLGIEHPLLRACIYHLDRALSEGRKLLDQQHEELAEHLGLMRDLDDTVASAQRAADQLAQLAKLCMLIKAAQFAEAHELAASLIRLGAELDPRQRLPLMDHLLSTLCANRLIERRTFARRSLVALEQLVLHEPALRPEQSVSGRSERDAERGSIGILRSAAACCDLLLKRESGEEPALEGILMVRELRPETGLPL